MRKQGSELVSIRHESITVEMVEERVIPTPETVQGYTIPKYTGT